MSNSFSPLLGVDRQTPTCNDDYNPISFLDSSGVNWFLLHFIIFPVLLVLGLWFSGSQIIAAVSLALTFPQVMIISLNYQGSIFSGTVYVLMLIPILFSNNLSFCLLYS